MKYFLLATVTMITVKIFLAAVVKETYLLIKIMHSISPSYGWENGVKQIKITEKNLSQSCILCQLLRSKTLASGSACIKHFSFFLPLFALYLQSECDLFNTSSPNGSFGYLMLQLPLLKKSNYEDRTEANILWPIENF